MYCIDVLWNLYCGQSSFSYDLSRYHFETANISASGKYVLIFGSASGVQATSSASTGHERLSGTLLIFETARPGLLRLRGERLFSEKYGTPVDAAYHETTGNIYLIFNTPHSSKTHDLLHVCFGTEEELISGNGRHADININRRQGETPTTACTADSYMICYQGCIYAYDAATLEYLAALATESSLRKVQAPQKTNAYALTLSGDSTTASKITLKNNRQTEGVPDVQP